MDSSSDLADLETWAEQTHLDEGVFGSVDGRSRSISGTQSLRSIHIAEPAIQLSIFDETSNPQTIDQSLSTTLEYLTDQNWIPDTVIQEISHYGPRLLSHPKWSIRAKTYKLLRRLPTPSTLMYCRQYLELCAMQALVLDDGMHEEREQVVKLLRWTMQFDQDMWLLSPQMIKTLMTVVEQAEDRMRNICLETLTELLVLAPSRLWYVNGIRTLTQAALDGPWSLSIGVAAGLAQIFDGPETRRYVHLGLALGGIVSALTEPTGKDPMLTERAKVAAFMLTQMFKSWGGIQYFLSDGRQVVRALNKALSMADTNGKIIVGMLLELFGLSDDFDTMQFGQKPRFDVELLGPFNLPSNAMPSGGQARGRLLPVDYMRTLLLMLFIDEGLIDALVRSALDAEQPEVVDASTTLIKWLSQHPRMHLPEKYVEQFQTLGQLVSGALGKSVEARRLVYRIESIPSISMGQLPSQQMNPWETGLTSSVLYRLYMKQRRMQGEIRRIGRRRRVSQSDVEEKDAGDSARGQTANASASVAGGSRGLAARVLRSSASTGNLKTQYAQAGPSNLRTVNEDVRGRRSLDMAPNTPRLVRGMTQETVSSSPFGSPFTLVDPPLSGATERPSNSTLTLTIPPNKDAAGLPLTPAMSIASATPPLLARSRTKSRSRARNSLVVVGDETTLASMIQESRVTTEDNPMRWEWKTIKAIVAGPIFNSRRLPEEITMGGFLTRLSRFFHPNSLEFCDLSRTLANEEYLEVGRQLIRILISSADGLLLIDESRLLSGIVEEIRRQNSCVRQRQRGESCFSFARLQMTMSPGYFYFLREIGMSVGGDTLLERNRLFDCYYQITELPDQVLLVQYILASMCYLGEGHPRNILRKVASSPYESLRLLVPGFLLYLTSDQPCRGGSVTWWAIEVLVGLLYDAVPAVRSSAAQALVLMIDLAEENPYLGRQETQARMARLLELQPMFDLMVVTDIRPLVLRVIGNECGFHYLHRQGVVDSEMEAWGALEGIFFVQSIELDILRTLAYGPLFSSSADGNMVSASHSQTRATPPHLFGELVKTGSGRKFLEEMGIPRVLFETLANIPWNSQQPADVTGLKATLWAIGAMGASREGYVMLEPFGVIDRLVEVAQQALSLSIKGTCMYTLALVSRNGFAAEVFRDKGWLLCSSCYGVYEFAVPKRLETIFNAGGWAEGSILEGTYMFSEGPLREPDVPEDLDSVQREIIEAIILMSSHARANMASKTLLRLRTSHPHYFRLVPLYCKAMHLLGKYRYRVSARRFIYEVFDVNLAQLHKDLLNGGGTVVKRRFSSSSQHIVQTDGSESQRKRASTLQEYSSTDSMFARRPTGLLDDRREANRLGF